MRQLLNLYETGASPPTWTSRCPHAQLFAPDGSRATARSSAPGPGWQITQYGPRKLWDQVEEAYEFWHNAGRPNYDRFGITASATDQYVWYDHPDSQHRWPLHTPTN